MSAISDFLNQQVTVPVFIAGVFIALTVIGGIIGLVQIIKDIFKP